MKSREEQLSAVGLAPTGRVSWNASAAELVEESLRRGLAQLSSDGAVVVRTGKYTGRAPKEKFVVREPSAETRIWWGSVNAPFEEKKYAALKSRVCEYLSSRDLFVQDTYVGADCGHQLKVRAITESPWHSLFARNMFIPVKESEASAYTPNFTILHAPFFEADPKRDGTNSGAFVILNFGDRTVLIGGTRYAGEMKKSIFTVMNYLLPLRGVLPMHCSANVGKSPDDVAIFFGLSGTGKTTLSTDPARALIGDDEHGWSDNGVFNFEGGCYAKVINLSESAEPQIFATTKRFGTILENVVMDEKTRAIDLESDAITENTRGSYPLSYIENAHPGARAGHPRNIVMLTCDAFGVLPPVAKLTLEQARFWFLLGYTAKVAGTEAGVKEPSATFSPCFGGPFLPLPPETYADLLGERMAKHDADAWLINTGWSGGPYGVGKRMAIPQTRAMLGAALAGTLKDVDFEIDPIFGLSIPKSCPGVPPEVIHPRSSWSDKSLYDQKAGELAAMIRNAFKEKFPEADEAVRRSGPPAGI